MISQKTKKIDFEKRLLSEIHKHLKCIHKKPATVYLENLGAKIGEEAKILTLYFSLICKKSKKHSESAPIRDVNKHSYEGKRVSELIRLQIKSNPTMFEIRYRKMSQKMCRSLKFYFKVSLTNKVSQFN